MTIRAGKLRHLLTFYAPNNTVVSSFNEPVGGTPGTVDTCWGSIEPLRGAELWQARQVQAETTHKIRRRYKPGVTLARNMYVVYAGRRFDILEILNPEERNRELEILAKEQSP